MVHIKVEKSRISQKHTDLLVIGVFEEEKQFAQLNELDTSTRSNIVEIINSNEFHGGFGTSTVLHTFDKGPMKKILLIGLGKREKFSDELARIIAGKVALKAKDLKVTEVSILPFSAIIKESLIEAISEGICLALYSFNKFKSNNSEAEGSRLNLVTILLDSDLAKMQSVIGRVELISEAVNFGRDISNLPPNECSPGKLGSLALSLSNEYPIKVRILERYEMESMGLCGIVAVGKGSNSPPKLIILEYEGSTAEQKPYMIIGKAVTFDTGGISLKPGDKMEEMKFDKCGGCDVFSIIKAIASLQLSVNVIGLIPCVENMPSSNSYRPSDIIKMYNGKTIEVLNTDAEGRIILADSLAYGIAKYSPRLVLDLATLTGACIIALGANVAAAIGTNKQLMERLRNVSEKTGERIWELPLYDEFHEQIKSNVADIKNIGGRPGGAITAAAFLSNFVDDVPWVHLDIAGTAWTQEGTFERSYNPKGATGFGIRTIVKMIAEDAEST